MSLPVGEAKAAQARGFAPSWQGVVVPVPVRGKPLTCAALAALTGRLVGCADRVLATSTAACLEGFQSGLISRYMQVRVLPLQPPRVCWR